MTPLEEIVSLLDDEFRTPYLPQFWRSHILSSLTEQSHLAQDLSLAQRQGYLVRHVLPIASRNGNEFGRLCLRLRDANELDSVVAELGLPCGDAVTPRQWLDWSVQSIQRKDKSVPLYCLCNYWSFPSDEGQVNSEDVIAFRMLRFLVAGIQGFEVPIRFNPRAEDIQRVSEDAAIRREVRELLTFGSGLACLADGWKDQILRTIETRPTAWISEYRNKNLGLIERHIDGYARNPNGDGERQFAQLCQRLRSGNGVNGLVSAKGLASSAVSAKGAAIWIRSARHAVTMNNPAEGLWCVAAFIAAPELRAESDSNLADAIRIMRKCIRLIRLKC